MSGGSILVCATLPDLLSKPASFWVRQVPVLQALFWAVMLIYTMEKKRRPVSKRLLGSEPALWDNHCKITVLKGSNEPSVFLLLNTVITADNLHKDHPPYPVLGRSEALPGALCQALLLIGHLPHELPHQESQKDVSFLLTE